MRSLVSIAPEVLKSRWRKFGVADGVLNVAVAKIILDRSCIVPITRQLIAGGMAQHVRMDLERKSGFLALPA